VYALELARQSDEEGCAPDAPARLVAPRLGGTHHYRVVDIKFTGLHLAASGELGNGASGLAYKAQLFLYNRALGSAQGLIPPAAFLLGRSWEQGEDGGRGCFEHPATGLGPPAWIAPGVQGPRRSARRGLLAAAPSDANRPQREMGRRVPDMKDSDAIKHRSPI